MAAQALAANGAKVYITGRRMEALEQAAKHHSPNGEGGGSIIPIGPCDVTKKEELEKLVDNLKGKEKYLNLLVAAAGIPGKKAPPEGDTAQSIRDALWAEETPESWAENYTTNVSSVYFSTVAFLPLLASCPKDQSPSVIVISSMSGLMKDHQGHFSYNAGKAAVAHLSGMMSREFHRVGVRVNSIAPGYFPSEQTMKESDERQKSYMPDEKVLDKGHPVPAKRAGKEEEMAQAVLFLTKCGYVTGEILKLDGGVLNEVGQT